MKKKYKITLANLASFTWNILSVENYAKNAKKKILSELSALCG